MRKTIRILILIICIINLSYFHSYLVHGKNWNYSNFMGFKVGKVASESMVPTLKIDDYILIHVTNDIDVGDVIAYEYISEDGYSVIIVHRAVSINDNIIICQGDANESPDEAVDINQVIGKVVFPDTKRN